MENKTLAEALKNIKASEFRWEDPEEEMDEATDEGLQGQYQADISSLPYSSLFNVGQYKGQGVTINSGTTLGSGATNGSYIYSNGSNPVWTTNSTVAFNSTSPSTSMEVKGDLIVNGKNIGNILDKIQDRLAIIDEPNPEKLEKFAALKKAYDHYKLLEKLIGED